MSPTITTHPQAATKVTADHLRRDAYLYVRQSTLRQVLHNTTSTQRQYDLRGRGIVLGLEVSRLARNNTDWHRLLEICALSGTLILDEDGLYDPCNFNDRLLLGLKGTMSEALCRHRHKASYADLVVMPTWGREPLVVTAPGRMWSA